MTSPSNQKSSSKSWKQPKSPSRGPRTGHCVPCRPETSEEHPGYDLMQQATIGDLPWPSVTGSKSKYLHKIWIKYDYIYIYNNIHTLFYDCVFADIEN